MSFVLLFDSQRISFVVVVVSCFILFTATARCFCSFQARLAAVFREVDDNNEETRQKCQVLFLDFHIPIPLRSRGSTARHSEQKYFCCFFCWRVESWEKNSPWDEITKFCALETIKLSRALVWGGAAVKLNFYNYELDIEVVNHPLCQLTEKRCAGDFNLETKEDAAITECLKMRRNLHWKIWNKKFFLSRHRQHRASAARDIANCCSFVWEWNDEKKLTFQNCFSLLWLWQFFLIVNRVCSSAYIDALTGMRN